MVQCSQTDTSAIHEFLQIAKLSPQLLDGFIDFPHGLSKFFSIHCESETAVGTGKLRIVFKPTNRLSDLSWRTSGSEHRLRHCQTAQSSQS